MLEYAGQKFEWINGQYWLQSPNPKERAIGVEIDKEIDRHLFFFKKSSVYKENLARAIGVRPGLRPKVLDLTAGLLGDSLMLLAMGCEVQAVERNPVVAFLIKSALENARHPLLEKFRFEEQNAAEALGSKAQVIYFDPMFEDANQKSLPKKEMRIFREIVGQDHDAAEILKMARAVNPGRVVVKRPRLSVPLAPDFSLQIIGKSTRYDVYFAML